MKKKAFENVAVKGENAGNQHFLLCPQCFLLFPKQISIFQSHLFCCLQFFFNFDLYNNLSFNLLPQEKQRLEDENLNVKNIGKLFLETFENILGKGENAGSHKIFYMVLPHGS